jgi:coatomer protein complex subunit alpha (xenin)
MAKIAEMRGDQMSRFHNALYLGNVEARIAVLREVGLRAFLPPLSSPAPLLTLETDPLAYLTAKSNGLVELAEDILATAGLNEEDVAPLLPSIQPSTLRPPPVITSTSESNWPSIGVTESFFDRALAAAANGEGSSAQIEYRDADAAGGMDEWAGEDGMAVDGAAAEEAEDAWDLAPEEGDEEMNGNEEEEAIAVDEDLNGVVAPGIPEEELWVRNSPLAADHVAAGSFETAMGLLNRQVGAVNFAPLKPLFLSIYQSSRLYLPSAPSLPPLAIPLRRNTDHAEPRSVLPVATLSLQSITTGELRAAYLAFQKAKFADAATIFRSILHSLLLVVTSTPAQAAEVSTRSSSSHC